jgi:2-polyprenyl-6-methoxyphenol hydroxylase-like FAD-dependent oxidoreductase
MAQMISGRKILISGAGIAGLTLAVLLKEQGYDPLVIERDQALRAEGYMMDFFGSGWDVAARVGLVPELRAIRYPIELVQFVDAAGTVWESVPIDRVRRALGGNYVYLRRSDLERILYDRAVALGVAIRFGCQIRALQNSGDRVNITFEDGSEDTFDLVFGADGVHSRVRTLVFGDESEFERFLGGYVEAFHLDHHPFDIGHALKLYEESDRMAMFYPLDANRMAATYAFRHGKARVPAGKRLEFVRNEFKGAGWISEQMLDLYHEKEPIYFDSLTQIVMPHWCKGRVALLGDACGCLTLIAGQGSHMAMAGAYVIARELDRHDGDYRAAFAAYEAKLKPVVTAKQNDAARFARFFIPSASSSPWMRRLFIRLMFSPLFLPLVFRWFGARSVLEGYD